MPRITRFSTLVLVAAGLVAPWPAEGAAGQEYHVNRGAANRVSFVSDAPLEDFEGVTNRIDGFVYLEGEGLGGETDLARSELYFEVDLASLDTGIGLRNRHMRENYLETDDYPFATFAGKIDVLSRLGEESFRAEASGTLSIHGMEQDRTVECGVEVVEPGPSTGEPPRRLRAQCAFSVALSDHEIPIPRIMFMKIDEVMELSLDIHLNRASGREDR